MGRDICEALSLDPPRYSIHFLESFKPIAPALDFKQVKAYTAPMVSTIPGSGSSTRRKRQRKFIYFALVTAIALSLCPIDPLFPMTETATPGNGSSTRGHGEAAHSDCIPNLCATLAAKEISSPEKALVSFSWLSPALFFSFFGPLNPDNRSALLRFNGKKASPKFTNKLYRLHAAFLI